MEKWQRSLVPGQLGIEELERGAPTVTAEADPTALAQAEEVAQRTRKLLATRGWCLWKCSVLDGGTVAVVRDELVEGVPQGYPVYTEAELEELFEDDISEATIRLVHEAKKLAGAKVLYHCLAGETT